MNNLLSYRGDARISASEKDLPVRLIKAQISSCAKLKLKSVVKGLSICVVWEEKFERRLQKK